jgi:predicted MFS family arabinose efflux permease
MISLANFFDAFGRSIGAFLGGFLIDKFGYPMAMTATSLFIILSFVWWVPSLKTFEKDYSTIQKILEDHAILLRQQKS